MSYHPDKELLKRYANGTIDPVNGFAVATHLESCPMCKGLVAKYEAQNGEALMELSADSCGEIDMSAMFNEIISLEQSDEPFSRHRKPEHIEVNGKEFVLPVSLSRFRNNIGSWKSYGGKVFSAQINIDEEARVNLLYISENVRIPQHTHKGHESTLVLHGGFSDEDGHYEAGDYMLRDASIKHAPYTKPGEDCLCLTILTEPMLFTQGVARIFNMFGKGMYP
ncbi:ChrR family anti-sigma-E factor [Vibrio sonorensis]|uniref:ChrR family anti-sigma-E factor n=1 Tax=Vibrio sonorensis TaxID=1004316 RepID=UPI0008DA65BD|nr:ChrR family anti-sigma-E factor [Vibrio sonorensis]